MKYQIKLLKPARKFIEKQPKAQQERILRAIVKLPDAGDIKSLSGHTGVYRLRVGTYRIVYSVDREVLLVEVMNAGVRGDIYK